MHESPAGGLPFSLAWKWEYLGELRIPAGVPVMSPVTLFRAREVGNVGRIDHMYVRRSSQSNNPPISFSVVPQGAGGSGGALLIVTV